MNHYFAFILGIVCAGLGGEAFVRGAVGMAHSLCISAGIIGVTVAAFATSAPELSVAITSAVEGSPQLGFGNALGSNILNVAFILGIALLFGTLRAPRQETGRNYLTALLIPVLIGLLAIDGTLSRADGVVLLLVFTAWLVVVVLEARRQRSAACAVLGESREWLALVYVIVGLGLLIAAGYLVVEGARGIAVSLGLGTFVVGAVIVAIGTTVPELATTVISKFKGHEEVGLNTVLGSNIFNGLLIVGVVAVISPIVIETRETVLALLFGVVTVAVIVPSRRGRIDRWRGVILLGLYAAYVFAASV